MPANTVTLSKPLETHSGLVKQLTFREPIAEDFIEIDDLPFDVLPGKDGEEPHVKIRYKLAAQWIARLTGLDQGIVASMSKGDWMRCIMALNTTIASDAVSPGNS